MNYQLWKKAYMSGYVFIGIINFEGLVIHRVLVVSQVVLSASLLYY